MDGRRTSVKVEGVVWVGTMTPQYSSTVTFFRERLGLALEHEEDGFALFRLPDGAQLEIFAPGKEHDHFTTGPVAEFLVDDVASAAAELRKSGVAVWGPWKDTDDPRYGWLHFRAPDGRIYGLTNGPQYERSRARAAAPNRAGKS
jgi:catechol 2,3-dioxygenase-like lactoylglutathione lyase family enzyme